MCAAQPTRGQVGGRAPVWALTVGGDRHDADFSRPNPNRGVHFRCALPNRGPCPSETVSSRARRRGTGRPTPARPATARGTAHVYLRGAKLIATHVRVVPRACLGACVIGCVSALPAAARTRTRVILIAVEPRSAPRFWSPHIWRGGPGLIGSCRLGQASGAASARDASGGHGVARRGSRGARDGSLFGGAGC